MTVAIDLAVVWLYDHLSWLPDDIRIVLVIPLVVFALYLVGAWTVRRIIPSLGPSGVLPVVETAVAVLGVTLLALRAVAAAPFRVVHRAPPLPLFVWGDVVMTVTVGTLRRLRRIFSMVARLRWIRGRTLLVAVLAVMLWWNHTSCDPMHWPDRCQQPVAAWAEDVAKLWRQTVDRVGR